MATLEEELQDLIVSLGTDWKNLWLKLGSATLTTTATNVSAAVNELQAEIDGLEVGGAPDASTTVKGISERATDAEALAMSATDLTLTPGNIGAITNVNNGLVKLDSSGKVASAQLPSYVDDVVEYANLAAFPGTGTTSVMYVALDTNKTYRWSGSAYVEISPSPGTTDAVPEGSTNLYWTNARFDTRLTSWSDANIGDPTVDLVAAYTAAKG